VKSAANFSPDKTYRYWLTRIWDEPLPILCVIGVNPSVAGETENDPTIRKVIGFAKRLGFGGILMLNLAAYVSTDPKKCRDAFSPIGFFNHITNLVHYATEFKATKVVAAWGRNGCHFPEAARAVSSGFQTVWCWGKNSDGTPRHPLMLPYSTPLEPFDVCFNKPEEDWLEKELGA